MDAINRQGGSKSRDGNAASELPAQRMRTENTPLLGASQDRRPANSTAGSGKSSRLAALAEPSSGQRPAARDAVLGERKPMTMWQMLSMTVLLAGIQFVWTVELGYGTPYLLSLGLSKPLMTLVWMAGPLSGLVIQPVVGRLSDRCRSKMGRRRPFIIGGGAFVVASVVAIAYARELAVLLAQVLRLGETMGDPAGTPNPAYNAFVSRVSIALAVIGFYVLDFSINTSQACARALALDIPPLEQQDMANAYAGRMLNLGSVTGYMVGFLDLRTLVPWKTASQMQALCLIAIIVFMATIVWTCVTVREEPLAPAAVPNSQAANSGSGASASAANGSATTPPPTPPPPHSSSSSSSVMSEWADMARAIWRGVVSLPAPVQRVCNVQFFAWVAWFPFLFFATTWVTEIMARTDNPTDPDFIERATRAGSFALFLYSVTSLGCSLLLPLIVKDEDDDSGGRWKVGLRTMWRASLGAMCALLLATYLVEDVRGATVLIIGMAFPWALAMWAPFAMVGEYVAIVSEKSRCEADAEVDVQDEAEEEYIVGSSPRMVSSRLAAVAAAAETRGDSIGSTVRAFDDDEDRSTVRSSLFALNGDTARTLHENETRTQTSAEDRLEGGAILGIHNMYVVLPQFVINAVSSLVFAWLGAHQQGGHSGGTNSIRTVEFMAVQSLVGLFAKERSTEAVGFVLRIGGCSALVAAALTVFLYDRQRMRAYVDRQA